MRKQSCSVLLHFSKIGRKRVTYSIIAKITNTLKINDV